jgi:hypothetical protein
MHFLGYDTGVVENVGRNIFVVTGKLRGIC